MAEFTPITMKRKRDGATRKVTTAAEQVSAAFDGFAAPASTAKKAATKSTAASKATAKTVAKKAAATTPTGTAVTDGATGK